MYVIRGLGSKGNRSYYTGRAGDGWLSDNIANAFRYSLLEGARRKAAIFNAHGYDSRFVAERICPKCGMTIDMDEETDAYCRIVG